MPSEHAGMGLRWTLAISVRGLLSCIVFPLDGVLAFEGVNNSRGTAVRTNRKVFDPDGDKWPRVGVMELHLPRGDLCADWRRRMLLLSIVARRAQGWLVWLIGTLWNFRWFCVP